MSSPFDGIGDAKVWNQGGNYLETDSEYVLAVRETKVIKTRSKGLAFVVNFHVVESNSEKNPAGSSADWYQSLQDPDIGMSSVKGFMASLLGVNMNNPPEAEEFNSTIQDILEEATEYSGPAVDHPLYDQKIRCSTVTKLTKKQSEFTQHRWATYED